MKLYMEDILLLEELRKLRVNVLNLGYVQTNILSCPKLDNDDNGCLSHGSYCIGKAIEWLEEYEKLLVKEIENKGKVK